MPIVFFDWPLGINSEGMNIVIENVDSALTWMSSTDHNQPYIQGRFCVQKNNNNKNINSRVEYWIGWIKPDTNIYYIIGEIQYENSEENR